MFEVPEMAVAEAISFAELAPNLYNPAVVFCEAVRLAPAVQLRLYVPFSKLGLVILLVMASSKKMPSCPGFDWRETVPVSLVHPVFATNPPTNFSYKTAHE